MIKTLLITLPLFILGDLIWLGFVAKNLYRHFLGHLMTDQVNWQAAILFYVCYAIGLTIFVIQPAIDKGSWQYAMSYGALFGFMTYMTYEFTNWAVIKDWSAGIVPIDIVWGAVLTASVATLSWWLHTQLFNA